MNVLISVIIPIYNAEKFLSRCVESVLNQSHSKLQIILVNDGSTDNSLNICKFYKNKDKRIIVLDKKNKGVSNSRNIGIDLAKGKYIGFVDSDDYIDPNMYETLLNKIVSDSSQACTMVNHTINKFYFEEGKNVINGKEAVKKLLLLEFPTSLWCYLYSKEIIRDIRLNEAIHFFEDFDFNLKILSNSKKISLSYKELYNYEINESSINSQDISEKKISSLKIFDDPINKKIIENNGFLKYFGYLKAYFLVALVLSISKTEEVDKKYYYIIKKYARIILGETLKSKQVPKKFKSLVLLCSINSFFLCKSLHIIKYRTN